jgi:PST family polysaccharide transporter
VIVYMKIDEVMLRQMAGPSAVGMYAAAVRISELWYFVPVALASSILPALLRSRERGMAFYHERLQQFFDLNAALAYGLAFPLALGSGWVARLAYGEAFAAAGPVLAVHIWASLFVFLGVARGQWLVNEGHTRFYFLATLVGAIANICLNLVLIPQQGAVGAAWATLIAYALAAWLTTFAGGQVRHIAWMQTRAILLPLFGWRYLFR